MITYDLIIYCRGIVIHYLIKNTLSIILIFTSEMWESIMPHPVHILQRIQNY